MLPQRCKGLPPEFTARCPEQRVTPVWRAGNRISQGVIPLTRPSTNDKAVFVKNPVKKAVKFFRVSVQFYFRIQNSRVLVVAVHLEDIAGRMR